MRCAASRTAVKPGDLVELDTLDVRPVPDRVYKQFTARDRVSRWDVCELASSATARHAVEALDALMSRMPFPVRAIGVDNGSEFMADFETACAARGVRLFVLPPRSPKLHGTVERANRTHTEEFHELTDAEPDLPALWGGAPRLGVDVQPRPAPPGPGLPDARRASVTTCTEEYARCTRCLAPGVLAVLMCRTQFDSHARGSWAIVPPPSPRASWSSRAVVARLIRAG